MNQSDKISLSFESMNTHKVIMSYEIKDKVKKILGDLIKWNPRLKTWYTTSEQDIKKIKETIILEEKKYLSNLFGEEKINKMKKLCDLHGYYISLDNNSDDEFNEFKKRYGF